MVFSCVMCIQNLQVTLTKIGYMLNVVDKILNVVAVIHDNSFSREIYIGCGVDGWDLIACRGREFFYLALLSRSTLRLTDLCVQCVPEVLPQGVRQLWWEADHRISSNSESKNIQQKANCHLFFHFSTGICRKLKTTADKIFREKYIYFFGLQWTMLE